MDFKEERETRKSDLTNNSSRSNDSNENLFTTQQDKVLADKNNSKLQLMHRLHPDIDVNGEVILDDFYCSLHKEIIINGRLRVCIKHLWFYANIFGIETTALLKWSEIISITRQKSALIIPNAIQILTPNEKVFLSGFVNRDKTYLLLHQLWHFTLNNKNAILPDKLYKMLLSTRTSYTSKRITSNSEYKDVKLRKLFTLAHFSSSQPITTINSLSDQTTKNKSLASDPSIVNKDQSRDSDCRTMHSVDKYRPLDNAKQSSSVVRSSTSSGSNGSSGTQSVLCRLDDEEITDSSELKPGIKTDSSRLRKSIKRRLKIFRKSSKSKRKLSHLLEENTLANDDKLAIDTTSTSVSTNDSSMPSRHSGNSITPLTPLSENNVSALEDFKQMETDELKLSDSIINKNIINENNIINDDSIINDDIIIDDDDDDDTMLANINEEENQMSDSSESNDSSNECDCSFLPNHIAQELIYTGSNDLFDQLFLLSSDVNKEFIHIKKLSNYSSHDSPGNADNEFMRETIYCIPLQWCGKLIKTTARHRVIKSKNHIRVSCSSTAEGMPYGNTFVTHVHYCIKSMGDNCCIVNVSFNIEYVRSVWAVTRKIIDKEVKYNINEFIILLLQLVKTNLKKSVQSSSTSEKIKLLNENNSNPVSGEQMLSEKVTVPPRKCNSAMELKSAISTEEVTIRQIRKKTMAISTEQETLDDTSYYDHHFGNGVFNGSLVKNIYYSMLQGLNQIKETTSTTIHTTYDIPEIILHSVATISNINATHVLLFLILISLIFISQAIYHLNSTLNKLFESQPGSCPAVRQLFNQYDNPPG